MAGSLAGWMFWPSAPSRRSNTLGESSGAADLCVAKVGCLRDPPVLFVTSLKGTKTTVIASL
jgi:hypothetical protein